MTSAVASHSDFERALKVLSEGKAVHGLYAVEDARALIRPIANYYWRQSALLVAFVLAAAFVVRSFDSFWVTMASVAVASAILALIYHTPPLRPLVAPTGFTAGDVRRALHALWGVPR